MLQPIESKRLRLLPLALTQADAAFVNDLLNQPDWIRYIGDRGVRGIPDALDYLRDGPLAMYRQQGCGLRRIELACSGESIGMCGLLRRDWLEAHDIGFALLPQFAGRGFAAEAAPSVQTALEAAAAIPDARVVICGTLYLAGHVLDVNGTPPD